MNATAMAQHSIEAAPLKPVEQTLFGRFMLPDTSEHPCQVNGITIDGATFITPQAAAEGLPIVAYLEELGRIEATTAEPVEGGFKVTFSLTGARRDRLEQRLRWLVQKQKGGSIEDRRHTRYEPKDSRSQITMPDGREYPCEVIDISLSGAAIKVDVMPSLGTNLLLGKMRGRVVRYLENGVGIEFIKPLEKGQLSEHVG
ncbi:PilZ domain-containing protein [Aestuariivirga sp.]|uniref:PilZ domain-containing protein n=1 Tax=Aestuariivirga sp. TaxID=2650926 RepID=UPI0039E6BCCE